MSPVPPVFLIICSFSGPFWGPDPHTLVLEVQQQYDGTTPFKSQSGVRQGKGRRYLPQLCTESKEAFSE